MRLRDFLHELRPEVCHWVAFDCLKRGWRFWTWRAGIETCPGARDAPDHAQMGYRALFLFIGLLQAGDANYSELKNLIVWAKDNGATRSILMWSRF